MSKQNRVVASDPAEQEQVAQEETTNIRPFRTRAEWTRLGHVAKPLTHSLAAFQGVKERKVDDPEKEVADYTVTRVEQLEWECKRCHCVIDKYNHGFLRDPDGLRVNCPVCTPAANKARARRRMDAIVTRLIDRYIFHDRQNLPVEAEHLSLVDYGGDQKYVEIIKQFADGHIRELFLYGDTGRGKTGLAISAVHELWRTGQQTLFLRMEEYLDLVRDNFAEHAEDNHIKELAYGVDFLVIDDLGAGSLSESSTGFAVKETQALIEHRHAHDLKTLVTSNMAVDGLGAYWYMEKHERTGFQPSQRLVSRLKGWYKLVEVAGEDLRIAE